MANPKIKHNNTIPIKNGPPSIKRSFTCCVKDNSSVGTSASCNVVAIVVAAFTVVVKAINPAMAKIENSLFIVLVLNFISLSVKDIKKL